MKTARPGDNLPGPHMKWVAPASDQRFKHQGRDLTQRDKPIEGAYRPIIYSLLQVAQKMLQTREIYANIVGVTPPQFSILTAIGESPRTSVGDLAMRLNVTGPFVTNEVRKLVTEGLVQKNSSDADKRRAELVLTAEGTARLRRADAERHAANATIFEAFTSTDLAELGQDLDHLREGLDKALYQLDAPTGTKHGQD